MVREEISEKLRIALICSDFNSNLQLMPGQALLESEGQVGMEH